MLYFFRPKLDTPRGTGSVPFFRGLSDDPFLMYLIESKRNYRVPAFGDKIGQGVAWIFGDFTLFILLKITNMTFR